MMKKHIIALLLMIVLSLAVLNSCELHAEVTDNTVLTDRNPVDSLESVDDFHSQTTEETTVEETTEQENPSQVFENYVINCDYLKAVEYYETSIYGNIALESEAADILSGYCANIIKKLLSDEITLGDAQNSIQTVIKITDSIYVLTRDEIDIFNKEFESAIASKTAYATAKELAAINNWKDAIYAYKEVIEKDSNYESAQSELKNCILAYKTEELSKAELSAQKGNYIEAINILKSAANILANDTDVSAKLTVYEKTYISKAIQEAKNNFVEPAKDYDKSLKVINTALTNFPDNNDLLDEKNYYKKYEPKYLYTLKPYQKDVWSVNEYKKSNTGKGYENCIYTYYSDEAIFDIGRKYDTFTLTIFTAETVSYSESTIYIYGDGKILYSKVIRGSFKPYDITLDISGVTDLKIKIDDVGIANAILQKTELD